MTETEGVRPDWPFGPFLAAAVKRSGLSKRAIATAAKISEGRLRQLETGYQKSGPIRIPVSTTATTVANLSSVLSFDLYQGLRLAGLDDHIPTADEQERHQQYVNDSDPRPDPNLKVYTTWELLTEIGARFDQQSRADGEIEQFVTFPGKFAPILVKESDPTVVAEAANDDPDGPRDGRD